MEIKKLPNGRTQATITFDEKEVTQAEEIALKRRASGIIIPGFRPGKAPVDTIRGKVNPGEILDDVVRSLASPFLRQITEEHKLQLIIHPSLRVETVKPLTVVLTFVEKPPVKMKGSDKIQIPKQASKVGQEDIDRMVQYLLEQERTFSEVDRAAKEGDQVTMDFNAADEAGADVPGTRATGYANILGSKSLLPGFEEAVQGLKKSDQKSFPLTFPTKYHAEHLRAKTVTFHVSVTKVEETHTPALTDDFARKHELGSTAADVHKRIGDSLRSQEEEMEKGRRERELFDAIVNATQAEPAPELLEHVAQALLHEMEEELEKRNTTLKDWMERTKKTPEVLRKDLEEQAKRRLLLRFGMEQMMEERNIAVSDEETDAAVASLIASVPEDQRDQATSHLVKGGEKYDQLRWQRKVEKLIEEMLK